MMDPAPVQIQNLPQVRAAEPSRHDNHSRCRSTTLTDDDVVALAARAGRVAAAFVPGTTATPPS
jgi:hypothetical protein